MIMQIISGSILTVSVALAACGPHMAGEGGPPSGLKAEDVNYTTQVTIGRCVMDPRGEAAFLAGIATALLSAAVTEGVNRVGAVLEESAKPDKQTAMASRNIEVNKDSFGPCVQIARGWYHMAPPPATTATPWAAESFLSGGRHLTLWRNGLWLAEAPDFYFEGRFQPSKDQSQLAIEPIYVRMDEPIASRMLRPGGAREVMVSFAFRPAGEKVDLKTAPGTALPIGTLTPGVARRYPAGDRVQMLLNPAPGAVSNAPPLQPPPGLTTSPPTPAPADGGFGARPGGFGSGTPPAAPPTAMPSPAAAATNDTGIIRSPWESDWFSISLADPRKPMTVTGLVTEVQGKSEFLTFVSEVFKGAKSTIASETQTALVPAKREAAQETAMSAQETLSSTWGTAFSNAFAKLDTCANGSGNLVQLAVEAQNAMMALNRASRSLDRQQPFSTNANEIDPAARDDSIRQACTAQRDKIRS